MGGSRTDTSRRPMLRLFSRTPPRPAGAGAPHDSGGSSGDDPAEVTTLVPPPLAKPSPASGGPLHRCLSVPDLRTTAAAAAPNAAHRRRSAPRRVSFAACEVREYSIVVGDHPCCPRGAPISLGWEYEDCGAAPLDAFERARVRRPRPELRTSAEERHRRLEAAGAKAEEIRRAQRQLQRARSGSARLSEHLNERFFAATVAAGAEEE